MKNKVMQRAESYQRRHRWKKALNRVLTCFAAIAVFCTTYALILPAITMVAEPTCGYTEHTHGPECYASEDSVALVCSPDIHKHTSSCYEDGVAVCGFANFVVHEHDDNCYDASGDLICNLPEISEHEHDDSCYISVEVAADSENDDEEEIVEETVEEEEETEYIEPHTHTDECYEILEGELICEEEEAEGHTHSDECYDVVGETLICDSEDEDHEHDDGCYEEETDLVCEEEEAEGHAHTDECYEESEKVLICDLEETEGTVEEIEEEIVEETVEEIETEAETELVLDCGHEEVILHKHINSCYNSNGEIVCGMIQVLEHIHGEDCMAEVGALICGLEEHTHNEVLCYISEEERELALRQGETIDFGMESTTEEETEEPTEVEDLVSSVNIVMSVDDSGEEPVIVLSAQFDGISWPDYEWQWQISANGESDWVDIEEATDTSYTISVTEESLASYYRIYGIERDTESLLTRNMLYLVTDEDAEEEGLNSIETLEDGSQNPSIMSEGVTPSSVYDMSLLAEEGDYYVHFCHFPSVQDDAYFDQDKGKYILFTVSATEGETISPYTDIPTVTGIGWDGKWYLDEDCTVEFNFENPVSDIDPSYITDAGDIYLYPGSQSVWTAAFITSGEAISAKTMENSETFDLDEILPVKVGYEFIGWYLDEYYTQPVSGEQTRPADLGEDTDFTVYYYAKFREAYVPFDALLATENQNDYGFSIADTLGTWYAAAGSTITVESIDIEHKVYCEVNGVKYPVYTSDPGNLDNINGATQATLSDVYEDYYLFNNRTTEAWQSVYTNGEVPWTVKPISTSDNRTIIIFDYMRVRVDLTFVMQNLANENGEQGMYFDIPKLIANGTITGDVEGPEEDGVFNIYRGTTANGVVWDYRGTDDPNQDVENIYTIRNVKYGQSIIDAYPIGAYWVSSRTSATGYSAWNPGNPLNEDPAPLNQVSRLAEVTASTIAQTGRIAFGRTYNCELKDTHRYAAMYAFEVLPGQTGDFITTEGIEYKVDPHYNEVLNSTGTLSQKVFYGFTNYSAQRYGLIRTEETITIGALPESTATDGMSSFSLMRVLSSGAVAASAGEESIYTQYIVEDFDGADTGGVQEYNPDSYSYVSDASVGLFEIYKFLSYTNYQSVSADAGYSGAGLYFNINNKQAESTNERHGATAVITKNIPLNSATETTTANHVSLNYKLKFDKLPEYVRTDGNEWMYIGTVATSNIREGSITDGTTFWHRGNSVVALKGNTNLDGDSSLEANKWYSVWIDVHQSSATQRTVTVKIYDDAGVMIVDATKVINQAEETEMRIVPLFITHDSSKSRDTMQFVIDDAILREYIPEETIRIDREHTSVKEGEKYVDKDSIFDIVLDRPIDAIPTASEVLLYRADDESKTPIEISISNFDGASFRVDPVSSLDEVTWYVLDVANLTGDTNQKITFRTDGTFYTSNIEDFDGDDVGKVEVYDKYHHSYESDPSVGILVRSETEMYSNYQSVEKGIGQGYNGTNGLYFTADNSVTLSSPMYRPTAITTKGMTLTYGDGVTGNTNRVMLSYKIRFDELPTATGEWLWLSGVGGDYAFDITAENKFSLRNNTNGITSVETGKWYTIKTELYQTSETTRQINAYILDEDGTILAEREYSQEAAPAQVSMNPLYAVSKLRTSTARFVVDDVILTDYIAEEYFPMLDTNETSIKDGAKFVPLDSTFNIVFNEAITAPVIGESVELRKKDGTVVEATISDITFNSFKLTPTSPLDIDTEYVIDVSGITNLSGLPIKGQSTIEFKSYETSSYSKIEDFDGSDVGSIKLSNASYSYESHPDVGVLEVFGVKTSTNYQTVEEGVGYNGTDALYFSASNDKTDNPGVATEYYQATGISTGAIELNYGDGVTNHVVMDYKIQFKQFPQASNDQFLFLGSVTNSNTSRPAGNDSLIVLNNSDGSSVTFRTYANSAVSREAYDVELDKWYTVSLEVWQISDTVRRITAYVKTEDGNILSFDTKDFEQSGEAYIRPVFVPTTGYNRVVPTEFIIDDVSLREYIPDLHIFLFDEERSSVKDGDTDVLPNERINLFFNQQVKKPTYGSDVVLYRADDPSKTPIDAFVRDIILDRFSIVPLVPLEPGATYVVDFSGADSIGGQSLDSISQKQLTFTVATEGEYTTYKYDSFEYTNDPEEIPQIVGEDVAYTLLTETFWEDYEEPLNRLGGLGIMYYSDSNMRNVASQTNDLHLFLYNRLRSKVTFDFRYEDENGENITETYDNLMYETDLSGYRNAMPDKEVHPRLDREGYTFIGWADENGSVYTEEDWTEMKLTGMETEEMVFLAVWEKTTRNVVRYFNDKDALADGDYFEFHYFEEGEVAPYPTMDIYPNSWAWTNQVTGKETVFDWNTSLYPSYGTAYTTEEDGDEVTYYVIDIYGIWEDNKVVVDYDINVDEGGIEGFEPVDGDQYALNTAYVPVKALVEGEDYPNEYESKVFAGWELVQNGTIYQPGDHVKASWWPTMNFVAVWTDKEQTAKLIYHSNYPASEGIDDVTYNDENTYAWGASVSLWDNTDRSSNTEKKNFSCVNHRFIGWNTEPDGTGVSYSANQVYTLEAEETILYAQWDTYPFTMLIRKYFLAGETESPLSGAEFTLYDPDGTRLGFAVTNTEGIVSISNLKVGQLYELVETKAPNGFNLLTESIRFSANDVGEITYYDENWDEVDNPPSFARFEIGSQTSRILTVRVRNDFSYVLPETGGIGIYPFIKGGIALMIISAALLLLMTYVDKRKKS